MINIENIYQNHEGMIQIIATVSGILIGYVSIIQPIIALTRNQNRINKEQRFKTYHQLIDDFSGANGVPKLDRQIAVVFELRRFKEYHLVTQRILIDWNKLYLNNQNSDEIRLITEINETLSYINMNFFQRIISKKYKK